MPFSIPLRPLFGAPAVLVLSTCVARAAAAHAGEMHALAPAREAWGPMLIGLVAGVALCALGRLVFRCLMYGWFTLWFTGMRLLQYGAIAGLGLALLYWT